MILTAAALSAVAFPVVADEVTYREHIRPLWEAQCAACHGAHAPYLGDFDEDKDRYKALNQGPRMDTYADLITFVGWPDTGALMRRLDDGGLHPEGKAGNMYEHLGADEEERQKNLALFKAWVGGDEAWTPKRWGEITKEELDRFAVSY
jgi:hypothetical protein